MIGTEQVWRFIAFGFLPLPGLLSRAEALAIRDEIERLRGQRERERRSAVDDEEPSGAAGAGCGIRDAAAAGQRVRALLLDQRVYGIPAKILGHDFAYRGSDAEWRAGDEPWSGGGGVERAPIAAITVLFRLDDPDQAGGCLRVVPGGHRAVPESIDPRWAGVPDYLFPLRNRSQQTVLPWGIGPQEVPHLPLPARLGDALVLADDLPRAAFGATGVRRELSFAFMANPLSGHQRHWVKRQAAGAAITAPRAFAESNDARLRKMVAPLLALGVEPS